MGILKKAADLVYTFRFLKLLTTNFEDTDAFKRGIINKDGKRDKSHKLSDDDKNSYTPFHKLVFNIKRLIPAGKLGSYAAALYLIKENYIKDEGKLGEILSQVDIDTLDFLEESSSWFIVEDNKLAQGNYRLRNEKMINTSYEMLAKANDRVTVAEHTSPVGSIFGLDVYKAKHVNTGQEVYVTVGELYK